jgi:hypothetical protein
MLVVVCVRVCMCLPAVFLYFLFTPAYAMHRLVGLHVLRKISSCAVCGAADLYVVACCNALGSPCSVNYYDAGVTASCPVPGGTSIAVPSTSVSSVSFAANSVNALSVAVADTDTNGEGVHVMLLLETEYNNLLSGAAYNGRGAHTQI